MLDLCFLTTDILLSTFSSKVFITYFIMIALGGSQKAR